MALLSDIHKYGTRAAQPAATAVGIGTLYYVSDESKLERSNGTTWDLVAISSGGGGGTGDMIVYSKHSAAVMSGLTSGGSYGLVGVGMENPTVAGTGNARLSTSTNMWFDLVTAAAGTSQARFHTTAFNLFRIGHLPDFQIKIIAPTTLTSVRLWAGLTSAAFGDVDTHGGHCAAFRFSSVAGDTGWRPITRDGTTQNTGTNIGTVTSATEYKLRIRTTSGHVFFSVDGGTEQDVTSNLPGSSQDLGFGINVIAQVASARNVSVARCFVTWGN